jgi:hypothetical protein
MLSVDNSTSSPPCIPSPTSSTTTHDTLLIFIFKKKKKPHKDKKPVAHSYDLFVAFHDVEHKDLMSALVPL